MYDELIKRLRELHPEEFTNAWDFAFACQQAMREAADAIEELSHGTENGLQCAVRIITGSDWRKIDV